MKRIPCIVFAILLLTVMFSGCTSKTEFKKTSSMLYFGDTESEDPLRICVDIQQLSMGNEHWEQMEIQSTMEELISAVKTDIGDRDIVVEFIPNNTMSEDITER